MRVCTCVRAEAGACNACTVRGTVELGTGLHLAGAGKIGNRVSSRCQGKGIGLYYFAVVSGELGKDRALWRGMAGAGISDTEATLAPKEKHVNF